MDDRDFDYGPILLVRGLRVRPPGAHLDTIRGIDLDLPAGRCFGLAGESGAGATTLLRALIGLLPKGSVVNGSVRLNGRELVGLKERAWREVRGTEVGVVLRDPGLALDRTVRVGAQVAETLKLHKRTERHERSQRVALLLEEVGLPASVAGLLPRDLGPAEGRRVMLAAALAGDPTVLLVDDGPPWLSAEEHVQFGSLVAAITRSRRLATMVMSHHVRTLARFADEIGVLCGGLIMEQADPQELTASPRLPYTNYLLLPAPDPEPEPDRRPRLPERAAFGLARVPVAARQKPPERPTASEHLLVGCSFSLRCPRAVIPCGEHEPSTVEDPAGHLWACWNPRPAPAV